MEALGVGIGLKTVCIVGGIDMFQQVIIRSLYHSHEAIDGDVSGKAPIETAESGVASDRRAGSTVHPVT